MTDEKVTVIATPKDAIKLLKRQRGKGMALFISVGQLAPIEGEEGRVFPILGNVRVTLGAAVRFIEGAYSETLAARGARIRVTTWGKCIFIGDAA